MKSTKGLFTFLWCSHMSNRHEYFGSWPCKSLRFSHWALLQRPHTLSVSADDWCTKFPRRSKKKMISASLSLGENQWTGTKTGVEKKWRWQFLATCRNEKRKLRNTSRCARKASSIFLKAPPIAQCAKIPKIIRTNWIFGYFFRETLLEFATF